VNPILAGVALAVIAGATVAVSVRDARVTVLAIAVVLLASAALADPIADPVGLAARAVGAILAAYLLWIAARDQPTSGLPAAPTEGSRIGWPAEILIAGAAAIVGFAADGLGAPALGPSLASAAGFALAALAVAPVLTGRDVFRVGLGLLLLMDAALLIRTALGGTAVPLEQLLTAGLMVAIAGTVAMLAWTARGDGIGGFAFATETATGHVSRRPEAHPAPDQLPALPGDFGSPLVTTPRSRAPRPRRPRPIPLAPRALPAQPDLGLIPDPDSASPSATAPDPATPAPDDPPA
jgi:hypothetical protein